MASPNNNNNNNKSLYYTLFLFISSTSLLFLPSNAKADGTASVYFLDSSSHQYFRSPSSDPHPNVQIDSMVLPEVGAAVSVLLGSAPPDTLSAESSSKLNKVLMPNPFDRPRAVFMLEVRGVEGGSLMSSALSRRVILDETKADIQFLDEEDVSVVSLNEPSSFGTDTRYTEKELSAFASWLGGSYVTDESGPLNGGLDIPLENDAHMIIHMSKKADREFISGLVILFQNFQRALEMHQRFAESMQNPTELLTGRFDGIKILQEQYGTEGIAKQGLELLMTTISKMFDSLQAELKGQIVGVIFSTETYPESEAMLNVIYSSFSSRRWMEEKKEALNSNTASEVVLVRRTLAWITGIILLVASFLGIHFLLNMPLTRDTLLYSNVKLD